ncbi:MAG: GlxA family transcriptional regulator [Gammaproteobacteria bacterium]
MSKFSLSKRESFKFEVRTIGILAFPGVEVLDITGPHEVFGFASEFIKYHGLSDQNIYSTKVFAKKPGPVKTLSGLQIIADEAYGDTNVELDTLIIPGAYIDKIEQAMADKKLVDWIKAMAPKVRRVVSVCTGSFFLAEAGLLDGCKATTHWNWSALLSKTYPKVCVEPNHIFIKDGNIFTSGGITSGIDLTLALVEEDWGRELAVNVARFMVVFLKRPGGQSQFSTYLTTEASHRPDIRDLQAWIMDHASEDLTVEMLAERVAMSPRNFARLFTTETGVTPAKYVEMVRIDHARNFLETSDLSVEWIAEKTGFRDPERMRRAFLRQLGVNPQDYRLRFSRAAVA